MYGPPHLQRRTFLKLGVASAVVLAVAGGAVALIQPGLIDGKLSAPTRLVMDRVAQAMLAKYGALIGSSGTVRKQIIAPIPGDPKAMSDIKCNLTTLQTTEAGMKPDPLQQLANLWARQLLVQLGLPQQHQLHQLAFFGL